MEEPLTKNRAPESHDLQDILKNIHPSDLGAHLDVSCARFLIDASKRERFFSQKKMVVPKLARLSSVAHDRAINDAKLLMQFSRRGGLAHIHALDGVGIK